MNYVLLQGLEMEQVKKVCHVLSSLKVGGAERFVIDLSIEQKQNGYQAEILSFGAEDDELVDVANQNNITVTLVKKRWFSNNRKTLKQLQQFDVIHIHSPVSIKVMLPLFPFLKRAKIIYTRHGEGRYDSPLWKLVHKIVQPFIHAVTFVSENGKKVFNDVHPWPGKKHVVIENGIPLLNNNKDAQTESSKLRLGSVGRIVELKRQEHLIQAWGELDRATREGIELHFIGNGERSDYLQAIAAEHEPQSNIVFHGFINDRATIQALFDVLVMTSESEGLSIAILEAMAENKPVIASDVGGNAKLVINEHTGFLYPFADIENLKAAIRTYYQSPALRKKHGHNASEHVRRHYSINSTMKQYEQLYGE